MQKTWAPRGAETARILYNITRGWVVHNEVGIFPLSSYCMLTIYFELDECESLHPANLRAHSL